MTGGRVEPSSKKKLKKNGTKNGGFAIESVSRLGNQKQKKKKKSLAPGLTRATVKNENCWGGVCKKEKRIGQSNQWVGDQERVVGGESQYQG